MEPRVSIITLGVTDIARSHAFYHQGWGFPPAPDQMQTLSFSKQAALALACIPWTSLLRTYPSNSPPSGVSFPVLRWRTIPAGEKRWMKYYNWEGAPLAVIKTTHVSECAFSDVTQEWAEAEGRAIKPWIGGARHIALL